MENLDINKLRQEFNRASESVRVEKYRPLRSGEAGNRKMERLYTGFEEPNCVPFQKGWRRTYFES